MALLYNTLRGRQLSTLSIGRQVSTTEMNAINPIAPEHPEQFGDLAYDPQRPFQPNFLPRPSVGRGPRADAVSNSQPSLRPFETQIKVKLM